jgi:ferredoxin-nitrite reductase
MLRMRIPNGILSSSQLRVLAEIVQRYTKAAGFQQEGNADITTRQNIQLRGIHLEDIGAIIERLRKVDLTSVQSGMDNVRNLTGSPVAGIPETSFANSKMQSPTMARGILI